MKRAIAHLFVLIALLAIPAVSRAQEDEGGGGKSAGMSKKKQEKHLAKKERKDKKSLAKEEKRIYKLHRAHQDKATRKRMKSNERRAGKHGQGPHRDPFFTRIFGHKH